MSQSNKTVVVLTKTLHLRKQKKPPKNPSILSFILFLEVYVCCAWDNVLKYQAKYSS